MIYQLLHLPYAHLWLPILAACAIATGVYWVLGRTARRSLARESATPMAVETTPPPPAPTDDMFDQGSPSELRRSFRRMGNPIAIQYTTSANKNQPHQGYVHDRSVGGLGLFLDHELTAGTIIFVRPANASVIVPEIEVEVRSCRPSHTQPGTFDLGCRFVKTPPYSILLLFG